VTTPGGGNHDLGGLGTRLRHPLDDRTVDAEDTDLDLGAEESEEV
jgi:hypothetical protein